MTDQPTIEEFRAKVRSWLSAHIPLKTPGEPFLQWDDEGVARSRRIQRSLWEGGIAGVTVPVAYGGLGLGPDYDRAFREEAADYRMPEEYGNAFNVVLPTLLAHGSEELKKHFIPRILNGDHIWCQFLSEPSGGSDLAGLLTRAERDGETWRLNGAKIWTTGGNYSDYAICLARTNPDVPKHAGLTMFIVPMSDPGITVVPLELTDGSRDFCQEYIDDVIIPLDHVIGDVNDGWRVATTLMVNERTAVGRGWSLGGSKGQSEDRGIALDTALLDVARRNGRSGDSYIRSLIGESWVLTVVQDQTVRRVSDAMSNGHMPGHAAALLKSMSGATGRRQGEIGLDVAGPGAVAWPPAERNRWGIGRLSSHGIGGGTTEMQRNAIAERLLGLPREPSPDRELPFSQIRKNTSPNRK
ncbi:MAG: acyl-CoA dehydrogenase family protein [Acidobacteriota bacterium]|nr:acyl-CoA dehydrogenase family protein [Acidobacteriota bacterium]